MKKFLLALAATFLFIHLQAQINAKLIKYMDVSSDQIVFVYGGDLWLMPKTGGMAVQITHSPGEESWPRFSPDGKAIAYTASYNGNEDIYVLPVTGGVPTRVTYQSHADRMVEWHPDGRQLLFASRRESGRQSYNQFYLVPKTGGMPVKLPIPYGELASYSPDGKQLAYITKITENYPFKRYRGGLASDVLIYDFATNKVENITKNNATDGKPAWAGDKVYFISDQASDMRRNIWSYHTKTKQAKQITDFKDFDITYLSAGPQDLVFEVGGTLYRMNLADEKYQPVSVQVVSDLSVEMPRSVDVSGRIENGTASPEGKRIIFEARGELFNVPVKEGYTINLTRSSGAFDRDPAWSPDGKQVAFWSDRSGEFEIWLQDPDGKSPARQLSKRGKGYGYHLFWSPDSKKMAFIDETNTIFIIDAASGATTTAGNHYWNVGHGGRPGYEISWSPDSRWIAFTQGLENSNESIFVYDTQNGQKHQVTSGFYSDYGPVFSIDGKYLFYFTDREFDASYSGLGDGTWIYPNATRIAALALQPGVASLLAVKNDSLPDPDAKKPEKDTSKLVVNIDFTDLESRLELLPPTAGNYGGMAAFEGKLVYAKGPNTGSGERQAKLLVYDLDSREEKTVIEGIGSVSLTADGKSILVSVRGKYAIIKPAPGQKIEDPIPTDNLVMDLVPKEEWQEIFDDTWRRYRDFFYDPNMQGVDWNAMRNRYGALIKDARTRWDVTNIQSNMQAELSAGHTYTGGGDAEQVERKQTGFLGIDWELVNGKYRIKRIVRPAAWNTEVRSPFDHPGVPVKEGDYILAVNGVNMDPGVDPYAPFEGLNGKTVALTVSKDGMLASSRTVPVKCLDQGEEIRLRYLEWIENNRKMVDKLSDGKLGYVYMSNTSGQGQLELVSMFYGQQDKEGIIVDERFNGGGQLADRFLELMQRPVVYNLHWRHGRDHTWPVRLNLGPKGMLINGWAGSGGDGLPWAFKELQAGPIVGERTLGILVGPATGHQLIDGGSITVPGARLYANDGKWFWEGEGVAPDYPVWDDPEMLMQGRDPQIEKVVTEVMKLAKEHPGHMTPAPKPDDRTAKGQNKQN
ncbi:MAG: PDZ domain-containing protein [Saprospiraceae bacterium]